MSGPRRPASRGAWVRRELHRYEQLALDLPSLVDVHDVGVRQARERSGLAEGPLAQLAVPRTRVDDLECDLAVELLVVGCVDGPHAASTEALEQAEAPDADRLLSKQRRMDRGALVRPDGTLDNVETQGGGQLRLTGRQRSVGRVTDVEIVPVVRGHHGASAKN